MGGRRYLRLLLRVLRELVVLDDLGLVLGGPVAHPDPSKVLCTLTMKTDRISDKKGDQNTCHFTVVPPILTRFFRHKCCLRSTRVFTINIQGTQAKAMITKRDCMTIYTEEGEKKKKAAHDSPRFIFHSGKGRLV